MNVQKEHINHLFYISAGIACLCCFARPDYNLPLMAFTSLTWDSKAVILLEEVY